MVLSIREAIREKDKVTSLYIKTPFKLKLVNDISTRGRWVKSICNNSCCSIPCWI